MSERRPTPLAPKNLVAIMLFDAMLLAGFALGLLNDWGAITWVLLGASIVGTPLILFAVVRSSRRATAGPGDEFGRR